MGRIVVIDDQIDIIETFKEIIDDMGHETVSFQEPEKSIPVISVQHFDLMLLGEI